MHRTRSGLVSVFIVLAACTTPKERIVDMPFQPIAAEKVIIYQMMTRLFGNSGTVNKPHGTLQENGCGKFRDITAAALRGIRELGVSHIWYTGVIEHATLTDYTAFGIPLDDADIVKGRAGSPFAIKDYYDVSPDLAVHVKNRLEEFDQLVERTHAEGLKALIDFVPNHVARGYKSDSKPAGVKDLGEGDDNTLAFSPKNNFYYLPGQSFKSPKGYNALGDVSFPTKDGTFEETPAKVTGNDQFTSTPGINEWFETVKLNYGIDIQAGRKTYFDPIPDTWVKMRDILLFWAARKVDGFRCDMAQMVPVDFWEWVIPQVKAVNPAIIFIAEIYTPADYRSYLTRGRFDFLYDKVQLYDTLRLLTNQKTSTADVADIQKSLADINRHMLHFLENHDEQRIASPFFAGDPWKAVPAMVMSATLDPGPVMIYFGQEVGEPGAGAEGFGGDDGRTTMFDYWGVPEHQKWLNGGKYDGGQLNEEQKSLRQFYGDILTLARTNKAINSGEYFDLTVFNITAGNFSNKVHAFARVFGEEKLVIVSSFNPVKEKIKVQIPAETAQALQLREESIYVARDLLRSGTETGLNNLVVELDILPFSSLILKVK